MTRPSLTRLDFFPHLLLRGYIENQSQKQCQIAVLPLGTGNDLARVLGWGSSADDESKFVLNFFMNFSLSQISTPKSHAANIVQLLDKYETASTKMLDRWSIMIFERDISFRRGMSISQSPDAILWYLQVMFHFLILQISRVLSTSY